MLSYFKKLSLFESITCIKRRAIIGEMEKLGWHVRGEGGFEASEDKVNIYQSNQDIVFGRIDNELLYAKYYSDRDQCQFIHISGGTVPENLKPARFRQVNLNAEVYLNASLK